MLHRTWFLSGEGKMDVSALPYVLYLNDQRFFFLLQVGVGQEAKLQEWFDLPQDMASPRYPHFSVLTIYFRM